MHWENPEIYVILINVAIQLVVIYLFFMIFKKFFGDDILSALKTRKELVDKLKNGEQEYQNMINKAKTEWSEIIKSAHAEKDRVVASAVDIANKKQSEIIQIANKQSENIITQAKIQSEWIYKELVNDRSNQVKTTAANIVKKIFGSDKNFSDKYLEVISKESDNAKINS